MTAVYTAYLFARAKARDLLAEPATVPPRLLAQALLAGSAALMPFALWLDPASCPRRSGGFSRGEPRAPPDGLGRGLAGRPTAHASLAAWEMARGRYRTYSFVGLVLSLGGLLAPWLGPSAVVPALAGLLLRGRAYVQAGRSVPLA